MLQDAASRMSIVLLFVVFVGVTAACGNEPTHPGPRNTAIPTQQQSILPPQYALGVDARFAEIAADVPGFGGVFYDSTSGIPIVYLTDFQYQQAAAAAVAELLGVAPEAIQFRQGRYDFASLARWKEQLTQTALVIDDVVFTDADEANNVVRVGLKRPYAFGKVEAVEAIVTLLHIPREAVSIEWEDPIQELETLNSKKRPTVGGIEISRASVPTCTLTLNTYFEGSPSTRYALTCSHCTDRTGAVDNGDHFQPNSSVAASFIGYETVDVHPWVGGQCPPGYTCTTADAALVRYTSGITNDVGFIARPTYWDRVNGSKTIDAAKPRLTVVRTGDWPYAGQWLHKIGWRTGWTYGPVPETCVDRWFADGLIRLCSDKVNAGADHGDSGSPVFEFDANQKAHLYGILWGGFPDRKSFIMSPIRNVRNEFGNLHFNAPGF